VAFTIDLLFPVPDLLHNYLLDVAEGRLLECSLLDE
jgi:hypothetical protein